MSNSQFPCFDLMIQGCLNVNASGPCRIFDISWTTTVNNPCNPSPWVITNGGWSIRYNIEDSQNCGGTCDSIQSGTATATIVTANQDIDMYLNFDGIGELEASNYEIISFFLNNQLLAGANATGGDLGCEMGPVTKNYFINPPYRLFANSTNTLFIDFTTNDRLFHVGAYYQVDLGFMAV